MKLKHLETSLAKKSYQDIDHGLASLDSGDLMVLLDGRSIRVGDSAAELLIARGETDLVIDRLLSSTIRTKDGRLRATSVLRRFGKSIPRAVEAYLHLINDRSMDVVASALFGLTFLLDIANLPAIISARSKTQPGSSRRHLFDQAIKALRKQDPFIYSSGFGDSADVWKLDKNRFAHKIGFP